MKVRGSVSVYATETNHLIDEDGNTLVDENGDALTW